jgi:hypothetical protein
LGVNTIPRFNIYIGVAARIGRVSQKAIHNVVNLKYSVLLAVSTHEVSKRRHKGKVDFMLTLGVAEADKWGLSLTGRTPYACMGPN